MSHCPIEHCHACLKPMIHQASRSAHQSASELGQKVHDTLPRTFTWADIDGALWRRTARLLRLFEHKSLGQRREYAQRELLTLLSRIVEHAKTCANAAQEFNLNESSGVYFIEEMEQGQSQITRLHDGKVKVMEDAEMLWWLALLEDERR